MLLFNDRTTMRRVFIDAWRRHVDGLPLEPLQARLVEVMQLHPEYAFAFASPDALARDFSPGEAETNPFLHLAMHVAIREQRATDRPPGFERAYRDALRAIGDAHRVEHAVMECLGQVMWEAQRASAPPDERAYLECVRRLAAKRS